MSESIAPDEIANVLLQRSVVTKMSFDEAMSNLRDDSVDAIYADPPFNTGVDRHDPRDRTRSYQDRFADQEWLDMISRFAEQSKRILKESGSVFLHLDWRGVHEAKVLVMDRVFGKHNFIGEIVWSYNWGSRQRDRFSRKHDTILHYAKCAGAHMFDCEKLDRVPYKAPELQMYRAKRLGKNDGEERIKAGQPVTDVFSDINVLGTASKERANYSYPTMKPSKLIRRLLAPVTSTGSLVVDPFAGSGAIVTAASELGCLFFANDASEAAYQHIRRRADSSGTNYAYVK